MRSHMSVSVMPGLMKLCAYRLTCRGDKGCEASAGAAKGDATARLTVDFRRVANSVVKVVLRAVRRALLLAGHAIRVEDTGLFEDFALRERAGREQARHLSDVGGARETV